jgi:uncharacterized membrane protein
MDVSFAFPVVLVIARLVAVTVLVGLVAGLFWVLERLVGRRGDREVRRLNRRLERGEITPDEYRREIARIEGNEDA